MTSANRLGPPVPAERVWGFGERLASRKRRRGPKREALAAKTSCRSWEAGGLRVVSEVSQGLGTGRQMRGLEWAGYRSQFAEPGRGKMPGSVLGKCCSHV